MTTKFPPLNSIKVFAIAAKHKSFTKAAAELNVTQGAISRQIAVLEDYLGRDLFERKHQSISLTKPAKEYLRSIDSALKIIEESSAKLTKKSSKEVINISILPSLSNQWFMPRLKKFKEQNPDYKINLFAADSHVEFDKRDDIDFSIRIAKGNCWKNFVVKLLAKEELICVCSPKLIRSPLKKAEELLNYNLLLHSARPNSWNEFFKNNGIKNPEIEFKDGYQHFFMLIDAAKNGLGIALVPKFLVKNELQTDQLNLAFDKVFKSGYKYYLISQKQKEHLIKIKDFGSWIMDEMLLS